MKKSIFNSDLMQDTFALNQKLGHKLGTVKKIKVVQYIKAINGNGEVVEVTTEQFKKAQELGLMLREY